MVLLKLGLSNCSGVQVLSESVDLVLELLLLAVALSECSVNPHGSRGQSEDNLLQFV